MQRRRHRLMMRRTTVRGSSRRRSLTTAFVVVVGAFAIMIGGSVLGTAGGLLAAYNYFASGLPQPNVLDNLSLPQSSYVYDRTGKTLLARFECQNRDTVTFDQIPTEPRQRHRRDRGPHLLDERRRRLQRGDRRHVREHQGRRHRPRRLDADPADDRLRRRAERAAGRGAERARCQPADHRQPAAGPVRCAERADRRRRGGGLHAARAAPAPRHRRQDPRADLRARGDRPVPRRAGQEADPRDVPQPRLLRQRLVRREGRGRELLRHHRSLAAHPGAVRLPRRPPAAAERLRPVPESERRPGFGAGRRGRDRAPDPGPRLDASRRLHHEGAARRGERGHLDGDEPEPRVEPAARAALHVPGPKRGGAHPRHARLPEPRLRAADRRLQDHDLDRPRPPGAGAQGGREVGRRPVRQERRQRRAGRHQLGHRRDHRLRRDRSTTTTARTHASTASSTSPASAAGSPARPSSRSPTAPPSRPARRRRRRSSSTRSRSSGRPSRRPTSRRTPTSTTTGRCSPPTRCATASTCRR